MGKSKPKRARKDVLEIVTALGVELTKETEAVARLLLRAGTMSETDISEKLNLKINIVRKILYSLSKIDVVYYTKDKHPEKKWWYIYSWTLDKNRVYVKYVEFLKKQLREKDAIFNETSVSFACKGCERKIEYTDALACDFKCYKCGRMLREIKPQADVTQMKGITKLKEEIAEYQ